MPATTPSRTETIALIEPYLINVNIGAPDLVTGAPVKAINRRTKDYVVKTADAGGDVFVELQDLSSDGTDGGTKSGVAAGDVIEFNLHGDAFGTATHTVEAGLKQANVDISATNNSATNAPGVTI